MEENRTSPRRRTLLTGKIVYGGETYTSDCTIRDLSETGARVWVQKPFSFPDSVILLEPRKFVAYEAAVKWRHGDQMGLAFNATISLDDQSNARAKILNKFAIDAKTRSGG